MKTRILGTFNSERLALSAATVTPLVGAATARPGTGRAVLIINNTTAATLYVGGSDVSATSGYPVAAGASLEINAAGGIYGFSTAGGNIQILEGF